MAVAYDAQSESHTGTTGNTGSPNPFTWTHTPVGTPRGVLVFVFTIASATQCTGVTYGGTAMTAVPYVGFDSDTEPGGVQAFYLDSPTSGAQTVSVSRSGTATMYAVAFTVTAATGTEIGPNVYTQGGSSANTNASTTGTGTGTVGLISVDDGSPPTNSLRFMGQYYGGASVLAAGSGSTAGPSIDFGQYVAATYRETTAGTGSRNVGSASGTDDRGVIALSVRERNRNVALGALASTGSLSSGAGTKGGRAALSQSAATTQALAGRHDGKAALGAVAAAYTMAATGRHGGQAALGAITSTTSMTATGQRSRPLGDLAAATALAAQGRKAVARPSGDIALAAALAAAGKHGGQRALGTISGTAALANGLGRKGASAALGAIQAGTTQAGAGRKGGLVTLTHQVATSQALAAGKGGRVALGDLAVGTAMAATGSGTQPNDRYAALGVLSVSVSMSATGRKATAQALGAVAASASLASGLGRKGGRGAATATYATALALDTRAGRQGAVTMALGASQAAQGRKQGQGVAVQSAMASLAILGVPGRAGALGDLAASPSLLVQVRPGRRAALGDLAAVTAMTGTGARAIAMTVLALMAATGRKGASGGGAMNLHAWMAANLYLVADATLSDDGLAVAVGPAHAVTPGLDYAAAAGPDYAATITEG